MINLFKNKFAWMMGLFFTLSLLSFSAESLPPPPENWVYDPSGLVSEPAKKLLKTLFFEHEKATSDQLVFAVFPSLEHGAEAVEYTNRLYKHWSIGQKSKSNGALLALYLKERKARIEVGYGLEPVLTDAKAKRILVETLIPELKNQNLDQALVLSAIEILRILESPLLQNGRIQSLLSGEGNALKARSAPQSKKLAAGALLFVILTFGLLIRVLEKLTAAEAIYSATGWGRPQNRFGNRGLRNRSTSIFGGGGGILGGGGGSGGLFGGGGGMSGGGGASGDW